MTVQRHRRCNLRLVRPVQTNYMVCVLVMELTLDRKKSLGPAGALAYRHLPKIVQE